MKAEVSMLAKRVNRLENDMVKVKQYEGQLDTLAIELHQFREEMNKFKIKVEKRFDTIDEKLDLILNALAINT